MLSLAVGNLSLAGHTWGNPAHSYVLLRKHVITGMLNDIEASDLFHIKQVKTGILYACMGFIFRDKGRADL